VSDRLRIGFGADDAGADLKNALYREFAAQTAFLTCDFGVPDARSDMQSYPEIGLKVAQAVAAGELDRAVLVCGTGIGMAISANKVPGVRAATAYDAYSVERSVLSNNCQVLALGARVVAAPLALMIVRQWLSLTFDETSPSSSKLAVLSRYEKSGVMPEWHGEVEPSGR
jgi:ribose 5-phosphate isomerase B